MVYPQASSSIYGDGVNQIHVMIVCWLWLRLLSLVLSWVNSVQLRTLELAGCMYRSLPCFIVVCCYLFGVGMAYDGVLLWVLHVCLLYWKRRDSRLRWRVGSCKEDAWHFIGDDVHIIVNLGYVETDLRTWGKPLSCMLRKPQDFSKIYLATWSHVQKILRVLTPRW